ncbi:MAG: arsenic efflux protein, partial [Kiritimatiellae bacterium]|nr:arsenic efflux protein [Kiritimatiellia bacterium]
GWFAERGYRELSHALIEIAGHAVMISGFVLVMMLLIEYLNVLTHGKWDAVIGRWTWAQSVFGAFMGATPGCLGAFAMASLYIHRVATLGALTATMVATCGDEAFVMLALFPRKALAVFGILFGLGLLTGVAADFALRFRKTAPSPHVPEYHPSHDGQAECRPFLGRHILSQWRRCTPHRGWLALLLVLFLAGVLSGRIGHHHLGVENGREGVAHGEMLDKAHDAHAEDTGGHAHKESGLNWVQITLLLVTLFGLFVVVTVPDHFLDEHLWNHIVRVHLPPIALWTFGALLAAHLIVGHLDLQGVIAAQRLPVLLLACLVGLLPASGPHLLFVTLFANGTIPLSTLLASSVVQDGHAMIPVLAHSRGTFLGIKAFKLLLALVVGLAGHAMGW